MMKAIKILFSIIGLLIFVCIFAVGSLIYFVDPDKLKPVLIAEVKNNTGYALTIDGKMSWSIYPRLAIKVDHLRLQAPQQSQVLMDASGVHIAIDLLELWRTQTVETLQSKVAISHFRLMNIKLENVSANISAKQQVVTLSSIKAELYGGTLQGVVSTRYSVTQPEWEWDVQADNIQLQPLLEDVSGVDSKIKISGIGLFKMQAKTSGNNREQLLNELKGNSVFNVNNGVVAGMDLNYFLQLADAMLHKQPIAQLVNSKQTAFDHLSGTAAIKNGSVETNDTLLVAPTFTTVAAGNVGLITRNLDFSLKIKPQLQDAKIKWDIPVLLTGDLNHPDVQLDVMEIQKMIASMEIDHLKEKAAEQIQKHIPGKTGEFLQKLLGK